MLTFCFKLFKRIYSFFILILISNICIFSQDVSTSVFINVVYPWEGKNISNVSKSFVFGKIIPYVPTIIINGQEVRPYTNGSFIGYVNISSSSPYFVIEAGGNVFKRSVILGEKKKEFNDENPFDLISSTFIALMRGSEGCISFKGKSTTEVKVVIDNILSGIISDDGKGVFEYCFNIPNNIKPGFYNLELKYVSGDLKGEKTYIKNFINVFDGYYILETSTDNVVLKNDANGYVMFMPLGVLLYSDMYDLSKYRVILDGFRLWVDRDKVSLKKNLNSLIKAKLTTIKLVKKSPNSVIAKIYTSSKVPFAIWEDGRRLSIEMHNSISNINWIVYDSSDQFINNVLFRQVSDRKVLINFDFKNKSLWGYDVYYSTEGSLDLDLKFKPDIPFVSTAPLKGLSIIIDPGHSPKDDPPYDGAVGPSGSYEYAINLEIAKKLYNLFLSSGATVYMTRYSNDKLEQVPLNERPRIAKRLGGDIYISIHNNALADGEDPFSKPRGFQIYYYHPHSKKLAEYIHKSFIKNIPLPDEGLRYGDYMVARITQMPSVLVENAYLILPQHEEMLTNPLWQERFAKTIFEGVVEFLKEGEK